MDMYILCSIYDSIYTYKFQSLGRLLISVRNQAKRQVVPQVDRSPPVLVAVEVLCENSTAEDYGCGSWLPAYHISGNFPTWGSGLSTRSLKSSPEVSGLGHARGTALEALLPLHLPRSGAPGLV